MVFQDDGIESLSGKGLRGESVSHPTDFIFAGSDNTYTGSESVINNEFIRKGVVWEQTGIHSRYLVELTSLEAIGSDISTVGLIGSDDVLFTSALSFIGVKTNAFNVQVEGEVFIRRPT